MKYRFARVSSIALLLTTTATAAQAQLVPMPTVAPNPQYMWSSRELTDGMPDRGRYASAAQTMTTCVSQGPLHTLTYACPLIGIAHYDATSQDLIYSSSTDGGETFTHVTVDRRNGDILGEYPALAFHGDSPVIAYRNATTDRLVLATPVGAAGTGNCGGADWYCRNVGWGGFHNAIAIHDDGRLVIAYDSGVDISVKEAPYPYSTFSPARQVAIQSPRAIAVAFDDLARVHVAWLGSTCVRYSHAFFEDEEDVECGEALPTGAGGLDLGINNFRRPHIAYTQYTAANGHRIRRAYKTSQTAWQRETVSSLTAAPQVGVSLLMKEDQTGVDAIAWGVGGGGLRVARPGTSTPWYTGSASFRGGAYPSLIPFGSGRAVVHYDASRTRLMFSADN